VPGTPRSPSSSATSTPASPQIAWSRRRETYANGVRKAIFRDPDGNQIGFGGAPA